MSAKIETTVLMDSPEDFGVEEHGWVPVEFAATPEEAVKRLTDDVPPYDDDFEYRCDGTKSWQRPTAIAEDNGTWFVPGKGGHDLYDEQEGEWWEYCPWEPCEPDAEGAVEFWDIEAVETALLDEEDDDE